MTSTLRRTVAALAFACLAAPPAAAQQPPAAPDPRVVALEIMRAARYATLVTVGTNGHPQARIIDPLLGTDVGTLWMATNPRSRKVTELRRDPRVTLLFFDQARGEFVTVLGRARRVTDAAERARRWKAEWEPFYPGGKMGPDVALYAITPFRVEIVSPARGFRNDSLTWRPVIVPIPPRP